MNFDASTFPADLLLLAGLPVILWLGWASLRIAWRELLLTPLWHRWAGGVLVVCLLWRLHGQLGTGLDLHLLGATLVTLTYGLPLGSLCLILGATLAYATGPHMAWTALPLNLLLGALLPALITTAVQSLARRHLPANYFVYLFINACLAAALGVIAVGVLATTLLAGFGTQPLDWLLDNYLPYYLLMGFSEAWLTGAAIALMVIWLPGWVASFDDDAYLRKPKS
ncbi:energy-coupling factor ABC transporter permease [Uliginosibacterium gangwonense]|uniref:energy-coupling factor ABC transporter permease n=1 Tax=Uliginosibacterium gangwonense TaxID=392736 RepID=UPI000381005F|nr:energy-coupling factor ABC transporter permease [Uliginosibacterium gangwonense]